MNILKIISKKLLFVVLAVTAMTGLSQLRAMDPPPVEKSVPKNLQMATDEQIYGLLFLTSNSLLPKDVIKIIVFFGINMTKMTDAFTAEILAGVKNVSHTNEPICTLIEKLTRAYCSHAGPVMMLKKQLGDQAKTLCMTRDKNNHTALQSACGDCNGRVIQVMLEILDENVITALKMQGSCGQTSLHFLVIGLILSGSNGEKVLPVIFDTLTVHVQKGHVSCVEVLTLFMIKNDRGQDILYVADQDTNKELSIMLIKAQRDFIALNEKKQAPITKTSSKKKFQLGGSNHKEEKCVLQ